MNVVVDLRSGARPGRVATWTVALAVIYVVSGVVALLLVATVESVVLDPLGLRPEAGTPAWGSRLAFTTLLWGGLAALAAGWLGRRLVRVLVPARERAVGVLVVGLILAATTMYGLHEYVRARYLYFDPDYAGPVLLAIPAMVAVALAAWGAAALPTRRRWPLTSGVLLAGAGFAAATLPSLPGIADGVSPSGLVLGACLAADAVFVGAMIILGIADTWEGPAG